MSVTQKDFRTAILDGTAATPEGLRNAKGGPAGRRFDVYRNNVAVSLTEALETGFPVIRKLLGEENFKGLTGIYLRQSPPESPMMATMDASCTMRATTSVAKSTPRTAGMMRFSGLTGGSVIFTIAWQIGL